MTPGASSTMAGMAAIIAASANMPNFDIPERNSRRGGRMIYERLFSAQTPKDNKDIRVLPSGSVYRVASSGAWVRLNHPRNKHDRRAAK